MIYDTYDQHQRDAVSLECVDCSAWFAVTNFNIAIGETWCCRGCRFLRGSGETENRVDVHEVVNASAALIATPAGVGTMTPYYEQDGVTIYHGDNRIALTEFQGVHSFDLLLTDPPYGIGQAKAKNRGGSGASRQMTGFFAGQARPSATDYGDDEIWDDELAVEAVDQARGLCEHQIIFGGNYYPLPPARCWLVWDKQNDGTDFADCEMAWTNLDRAVRRLIYRWNGMLQQPGRPKETRIHPAQKPEAVIVWALGLAPTSVKTVLDPFMGIGTTLVAAKRLGKRAVGIEQSERWCEIAAQRLQQGTLFHEVTE